MYKILLIVVSFFIFSSTLNAQDTLQKNSVGVFGKSKTVYFSGKHRVGLVFGMSRMDFFTGLNYSQSSLNLPGLEPFVSLEFGVNRTFFQSRLYPRLSIGIVYKALNRNKFSVGPAISYSYSILKVNLQSAHFHQWNEVYAGYKLSYGQKFKVTNMAVVGLMNERYFNQLTERTDGVNSIGFYFNLGLTYAL